MRGLSGKIALVTGAAGGIGRAICRLFAEESVRVAALDIDEAGLGRLKGELGEATFLPVACDITHHDAVADAVSGVEDADLADGKEVHTHEVPEDDVPGEYLDEE